MRHTAAKRIEPPTLNRVLLRLMLLRLFVPLVGVGFVAIGGAGYFGVRSLITQQQQATRSTARLVEQYLDQAGKILDAVARTTEALPEEEISISMQSTWEAYSQFETIYYLDENGRIKLLVPFDPTYIGLDMSRLADIQETGMSSPVFISRPFMSLRTGEPTVSLVRPLAHALAHGSRMIGELNLSILQRETAGQGDMPKKDSVFILDQSGTLLAHPVPSLVQQQTNMSDLEIFRRGSVADATIVYKYEGTWVLGSTARMDRVGWVVVNQIPLSAFLGPYLLTLAITFAISLVIWLTLTWSLRKRLHVSVVAPLEQLSRSADALAAGNYDQLDSMSPLPAAFTELNKLANDFLHMSSSLQARETALRESEERYRNLFNRVPAGIFRTTSEGHILDANEALVHILGYPNREALLAANAAGIYLSQEDRAHWMASADKEEIMHGFETQMRRPDGNIIWVHMNGRIIHDEADRMTYIEGVMEDITGRRLAEEALLRAQEELIRKEKLSIIGQLAGVVGHEIRNPLAVMNNAVYFLKTVMPNADDIVKEYLDIIRHEIDNSQRIVSDLLDFARTKTPRREQLLSGS